MPTVEKHSQKNTTDKSIAAQNVQKIVAKKKEDSITTNTTLKTESDYNKPQ